MATSFGAGAARGIETGFGLGLRADAAAEEKRQRAVQEARQAQADTRAEEELQLRRSADQRAETRLQDTERRGALDRAGAALQSRRAELLAASTAAQTAGAPVPAGMAEEYSTVSSRLAQIRQAAQNDASRLAAGQLDLNSMPPAQAYKAVTVGTGMTMKDLAGMPQHANDLQAGIETNNQGLTLQAVNGLFGPRLRQGVGEEAPSGGKITRKEVIRLVPAKDANGQMDPDKVFPIIRVYVQRPGDPQERYYDAPMTRGASVQDEQVEPISVKKSLDWVGNLGVLTTALQRPDIAEKMAQGEREAGPEVQKYFDEFYALTKPSKKTTTREKTDMGDRWRFDTLDQNGNVTKTEYEKKGAPPKLFSPGAGAATYAAKLAEINRAEKDGEITPAEAAVERKALRSGIKPGSGGGGGDEEPMSPEAVDMIARAALKDRMALSNVGRGVQGAKDLRKIMNKMAEMTSAGDGKDLTDRRTDFAADKKSLDKIIPQFDAVEAFTKNTVAQGRALKDMADKVDSTGVPVLERWIRAGRKSVAGDPAVTDFNAQLTVYRSEAARILTNPNLTGVLTVDARKEMQHVIDNNATAEQVKSTIDLLERDFTRRRESLTGQIEDIKERMRTGVSPKKQDEANAAKQGLGLQQPAAAPQAPPGVRTATNPKTGEKLMLQNGQWVPLR